MRPQPASEFREIAHSGGEVTYLIERTAEGRTSLTLRYSMARPNAMAMVGVYALFPGIPIARMELKGLFQKSDPPPTPNSVPVFLLSDSEGHFDHKCLACSGYWRSGPWPNVCPYCHLREDDLNFLSDAQRAYVAHCCQELEAALTGGEASATIDLDSAADACLNDLPRPSFYVSEESQQHRFTCRACGEFNDIIGRFGYCSKCGTRCDVVEFEEKEVGEIRARLAAGASPENCLRDAVAAFDSVVSQYAKQLAYLVPSTKARKHRLTRQRFHDVEDVHAVLSQWFDIDIFKGVKEEARNAITLGFLRRHLFEHNGGEVDQKFLDKVQGGTYRLKQRLRETEQDVAAILGPLTQIVRNLHNGFHELFPPVSEPIELHQATLAARKAPRPSRSASSPGGRWGG